ncbi:hypothetical protein HQ865_07895 [Mucilaginibacter mali]|uniref:Uncharacterized protein n=1 Tax=Mucilaginibacter mali TaxID=2740462 RepID=A0A7D4UCS5_9SPHI|nr:hypothetical protein [Mucilaginibacter mali]QKJ29679.1 hypothetical protein HQ865_07895 [Mucilaginibacter mali]
MTLSSFYEGYIVPGSTLIPITAGIIYYKRLNKALHTLTGYLIVVLLINIVAVIMSNHRQNNLPLLHFYTMFELLAVMLYYKYAFANKRMDGWIMPIMIIYPVLCVLNFTFLQSIYEFNTYTRPLEALIIIMFSGIYLAGQHPGDKDGPGHNPGRWVAGGFLMYFFSSLFQFIFSNVISKSAPKNIKLIIWDIHDTFVLIMYLLFFVAIRYGRDKR